MKTEPLLMNMHIHIWTLVTIKDNGDSEVYWPLWVYSTPSYTKTKIFRCSLVRESTEEAQAPLSVPELDRQEVVLQEPPSL